MNCIEVVLALCWKRKIAVSRVEKDLQFGNGYFRSLKRKTIPSDRLEKLADYFGVSIDFLLGSGAEPFLLVTEYRLAEAEKAYKKETDPKKRNDLALEIDLLNESLEDQRMTAQFTTKKAPTSKGERETVSDDGIHIGSLYDRADEKDQLLTHSVLDKYEEENKIVTITPSFRNPGGFIELDVYDEPAAAGFGNYLDAPQARREQFPAFMIPKGTTFGIRISGNSMMPLVEDGTTVFVKQTMVVESGKVGVFILNGASYCKQLVVDREKKEVRLHSFNEDYEDIIVSPSDTLITIGQVL